jgi:hypothetical protein
MKELATDGGTAKLLLGALAQARMSTLSVGRRIGPTRAIELISLTEVVARLPIKIRLHLGSAATQRNGRRKDARLPLAPTIETSKKPRCSLIETLLGLDGTMPPETSGSGGAFARSWETTEAAEEGLP